jgi:alkylhydroperoxidase/carboxymuconolactone decarboxylase family protein YurZ
MHGASREEVLETLSMAVLMGGGPSVVYAAQALDAFDQFTEKMEKRKQSRGKAKKRA